jgi:GMP synthase (glutamine-hydrolysing)
MNSSIIDKKILIIKAGSTLPVLRESQGDFEDWIAVMLGPEVQTNIVNPVRGENLPDIRYYMGAVITGSHDNVTDKLPWMRDLAVWVRDSVSAKIPILGICFGHQLIACAPGGKVDFHLGGLEAGIKEIQLTTDGKSDRLLGLLTSPFLAHVTHKQTVIQLPAQAVPLAFNSFEKHHAFRVGEHVWGVQFHPEYTAAIMREYVKAEWDDLHKQGIDPLLVISRVNENQTGSLIMQRFTEICSGKQ